MPLVVRMDESRPVKGPMPFYRWETPRKVSSVRNDEYEVVLDPLNVDFWLGVKCRVPRLQMQVWSPCEEVVRRMKSLELGVQSRK